VKDTIGSENTPAPWKILIIDDESGEGVQFESALQLSGFQNRAISIIRMQSIEAARSALADNPDIAVVFLKTILSTMEASRNFVEYIRTKIGNTLIRIILYGSMDIADSLFLVKNYGISECIPREIIYADKIKSSLITALRVYAEQSQLERRNEGLEQIVETMISFGEEPGYDIFIRKVFAGTGCLISGVSAGSGSGVVILCGETESTIDLQTGYSDDVIGKSIYDVFDAESVRKIESTRDYRPYAGEEGLVVFRLKSPFDYDVVVLYNYKRLLDDTDVELLNDFYRTAMTENREQIRESEVARIAHSRVEDLRQSEIEFERAMRDYELANERLAATNLELEAARMITEQDMRMAVNIQQNLLPKVVPPSSKWDVSYFFKPMSGVSGDFYDFYTDHEGELFGLCLFDVSGHGVASGLITMLAKSITFRRFRSMVHRSLNEVVDAINEDLIVELSNVPNFLSGVMLRFKGDDVEYINAGHPDAIIKSHEKGAFSFAVREDNPKGFYLGIGTMNNLHKSAVFSPQSGESIILFSDCLFEGANRKDEQYGLVRLLRTIEEAPANADARELLNVILLDYFSFRESERLEDDLTIIVAHRK
jgi:serine phosphatase RsbU (regulator of sigma subunit)